MDVAICVYPDCCLSRRSRGLCHGHFQAMRSYVRKGKADETDLEARGLLLPKGTGGNGVGMKHDAFLIGSSAKGEDIPSKTSRLADVLEHICGGDSPCTDESRLRQWAYEAVTLGRSVDQLS